MIIRIQQSVADHTATEDTTTGFYYALHDTQQTQACLHARRTSAQITANINACNLL